jgi:hypothetical protein
MCEGTTTVTSGPQRYSSNPATSRANERDQRGLGSRSLDGMQEVTALLALPCAAGRSGP